MTVDECAPLITHCPCPVTHVHIHGRPSIPDLQQGGPVSFILTRLCSTGDVERKAAYKDPTKGPRRMQGVFSQLNTILVGCHP